MSGLVLVLGAPLCFGGGFVVGAIWQSLYSVTPDPDYDPARWSDFQ